MAKKIFLFVFMMRALAAIAITNAHYIGVYPIEIIANGGLLGDVLFFAASGFCLASVTQPFGKWYSRRFIRIYVPTWVITIIYLMIGAYGINSWQSAFRAFIWPTHWHFIASIILLYIPLYFVARYITLNVKNYWLLTIILFSIQLVLYMTVYDYHYYHIDTVREPMIEFLFFQAMLLGLHYRWRCENCGEINCPPRLTRVLSCLVLGIIYFVSKMVFVKNPEIAPLQIFNQVVLWLLLYLLFDIMMKFERRLYVIKDTGIWKLTVFISDRTLEIYLVQYVIIARCSIGLFPLNWMILTSTIILSATVLHYISQQIVKRL